MSLDADAMGEWRHLDGSRAGDQSAGADVVCAHLSDLHGQLVPGHRTYYDSSHGRADLSFDDTDRRVERGGGVPLLSAKLDRLDEAAEGDLLRLMSGDTFHGTAVTTYTDGRAMVDPVNDHLRPDVYVPGNWDFSPEAAEDGAFHDLMAELDAPVLANNLYDWESDDLLYDAVRLLEVGGLTVGVVGMTNVYVDRMAPAFWRGTYRFGKHPALLAESAERAREEGADVVLGVTEIGLPWLVQAAKDMGAFDVLFSAHTHEYTFEPIVVRETETVVVESGMGEALGRVDLRDVDGVLTFRHHLYCLTEGGDRTPTPDEAARETVDAVRAPFLGDDVHHEGGAATLDRSLDAVVGETETPLFRQAFLENTWSALFTDALRDHFDADLAVAHGFRYGTAVPPGEVTLGQVYTALPMATPVARGDALGQQLTDHVEDYLVDNFTPYAYDQEDGRVRSFSGNVEVVLDPTAKRGRRLVELLVDGDPVDPEATYDVATFRRPGDPDRDLGGCGFPFANVEVDEGTLPADVVADYLAEHSPVAYPGEGRVRTAADGGDAQNTPADGPYPYVQPGVDDPAVEYTETRCRPTTNRFPSAGRNRYR
ncbi:bifunctional metallophosphatase/5'-nucleotidase [Halobacteriales archaeon Cl-PHB]